MSELLDWALYYQKLGLSIIPVSGKVPIIKWAEYQERCASEKEIKDWWKKWPTADIGCITGPITGRLILDIDGETGLQNISGNTLPTTQTVRTRRGVQYHYKNPLLQSTKSTVAGLYQEVDVRGEGGLVLLPPSLCSDGSRYEWINDMNTPLADCPQWLIDKLNEKPKYEDSPMESREPWIEEALSGVGNGERHQTLVKLFGYYANTMPLDVAAMHIRSWNEHNSPPLANDELEEQIRDVSARFKNGEYTTKFKEPIERKLDLMSATDLALNYSKPPQFLVPGLIPQGTRTIFSGWQGRGKSFAMSDLVIEVSRKKGTGKWLGEFPVAHGPVIYVDNENAKNLVSWRMSQLLTPKGLSTNDIDLHFIIGNHWKITDKNDYDFLVHKVKEIKPVLIIVDSLASIHSLDENTSKDMRFLFDNLMAPFCEEFNCGILAIDHERKDTTGFESSGGKRLRGSGAKGDAVDTIISLNENNETHEVFMEHSKSRYGRKHVPVGITLEYVHNGAVLKAKEYIR